MKTKNVFRLGFMLIFATILTSCGKDNVSGQPNHPTYSNGGTGAGLPSHIASVVYQENPCRADNYGNYYGSPVANPGARQAISIPLQGINVAVGSFYIGVTSLGDIASVTNDGSGPVMHMDLCPRGNTVSRPGRLIGNPRIASSLYCQVNEISDAIVELPGMYGTTLPIRFRPIYFGNGSSLCRGF